MNKKNLPAILVVMLLSVSFFACKKNSSKAPADPSRLYFPTEIGKSVDYNVDSVVYYMDTINCLQRQVSMQMRYTTTDTFRDNMNRLSYLVNIYTRANENAGWQPQSVVYVTPTDNSIEYTQNTLRSVKMTFPIQEGATWKGHPYVYPQDTASQYLANWNFSFQNLHQSFNTDFANFVNTVTVVEDDEVSQNHFADTTTSSNRTFAKEVYAYNIGMIYREQLHYSYAYDTSRFNFDSTYCRKGYSVVMRAVDHN